MKLTDKQIDFITETIVKSNIASTEMKEDLIDHFCCAIEDIMEKGNGFKEAYDKAFNNICPDGFDEIHNETVYLLTHKKEKKMRKLMYVSGYLSIVLITLSLWLKIFKMPGAGIALFITFLTVMFLFLPVLFMHFYKRNLPKSFGEKTLYVAGFMGILLLFAGVLFKIMHWPGGFLLTMVSLAVINFLFFPMFFYRKYKRKIAV
ncbi:MAG: hypothetical protein FWH18_09990 [Marinilabiliaceae bacterium]|nr:hypothetical protein [Marinilabiliaceae bacterium]